MSELAAVEDGDPLADEARTLLAKAPWNERTQALTLLGVRPPERAPAEEHARLWLILDAEDVRDLADEWRDPLLLHGLRRLREASIELTVVTSEGAAALLESTSRRALEARWELRHAVVLRDGRGRFPGLSAAAGRLPEGALERLVRPLYLQADRAFGAWQRAPANSTAAAIAGGEAASAVTRLACVLDEGAHPIIEWLPAAARETALGRRIAPWIDSLTPGLAADILAALVRALRTEFADRDWLRDPETYGSRPPPRRR